MSQKTAYDRHWGNDENPYLSLDDANESYFEFASNSIVKSIKVPHRGHSDNDTDFIDLSDEIQDYTFREDDDEDIEINIPKIDYTDSVYGKSDYIIAHQSWSGHVISINKEEEYFTARLEDKTNGGNDEEAEIGFDEITSPQDIELIKVGAVFYWTIGTSVSRKQHVRQSIIKFQRLIPFSAESYERAWNKADDISDLLTGE